MDDAADTAKPDREEFSSLTLSIDHLVNNRSENDPVVIKTVWSQETAAEALQAQLDYFKDVVDYRNNDVVDALRQGETAPMIYAYVTPRDGLTNVIVDVDALEAVKAKPELSDGTLMATFGSIIELGTDMIRAEREKARAQGRLPNRVVGFAFQA